ncbi:MAG: hypothetical protein AB8H79_08505 [Myxococcota bacterium]
MRRAFLVAVLLCAGCPSENRRAIDQGYVAYSDIEGMGPLIWDCKSAGREGRRTTLATASSGVGAPGRVDVAVAEVGDLDESMSSIVGERSLLRVDVSSGEPVVQSIPIPTERSDVLAEAITRPETRVLHTGTDASAIAAGRLDGQLRDGTLAVYRSGVWDVFDVATLEVRIHEANLVVHSIDGLLLRDGSEWTAVEGDALGPADSDGFVTLAFEPGLVRAQVRDWSGALISTETAPVSGDRLLSPIGVVDNGTPESFVAVLSDCDVPIGELWRFDGAEISAVQPSRLGPLQPSRSEAVYALDSFYSLPGETAFREVREGALAPWIESRVFWGHSDVWSCAADSEDPAGAARCKERPLTSRAHPDSASGQVAIVTLDQTDSHPRIHLRQQALPWQVDPVTGGGCDDSRCIDPDDASNPNTECVQTTLDPDNYTCVPPGTVASGERYFNGLPFTETPLAVTFEPADLDDEEVVVDPRVCGAVSTVQPPADYEAEVHGFTELRLSAPGYAGVSVLSDPDWLDGGEVILNRGEVVGPIDEVFYAYSTPELLFVASENQTWSYSATLAEWRAVVNVEPALPLEMRTLGPHTLLRNIDDETWYLDGKTFSKVANYPVDFDTVSMSPGVWWLSFDPGRGTLVHDRGFTRYVWSWTGAGPAIHHDPSPEGEYLIRILDDGSVNWHQNKPAKTEAILPAGWFKNGSRVMTMTRFNSVNPSPVTLVQPTVAMTDDGDCFQHTGGCTLTYLYAGNRTALTTSAVAFAKGEEAAVWVDASGVHRGVDGLVQTDSALGVPTSAAGMLDQIATCRGSRCQVWRADTWPMTELVGWDDGEPKIITAVGFRYFVFESSTQTIRYDRVTSDLVVLDGSSDRLMANGATYAWTDGWGAFDTQADDEVVFARGAVLFPVTDELGYPPCIPFSQRRFVDGLPEGRELLCAAPPGR